MTALDTVPGDPGASIPGATRRPDGLYDVVLPGPYGPYKAGDVLGVDALEKAWIEANIKPGTPVRPAVGVASQEPPEKVALKEGRTDA